MNIPYVPLYQLCDNLNAQGIPISGVTLAADGITLTVNYLPSATQAQISQGNTYAASFNLSPIYRRKFASILTDIAALSTADQQQAFRWATAMAFFQNPRLVNAYNNQTGHSIAVETTDSTQADS